MPSIIKLKKRLNSKGDTMVEILIVLAVLSLAFALASATANKGIVKARAAQEHTQALGILSSQIELIREAVAQQTNVFSLGSIPFCISSSNAIVPFTASGYTVPSNSESDNFASYPVSCTSSTNTSYYTSVTYVPNASDATQSYFQIRVRWDGAGGLGRQQENFAYRIHEVVQAAAPDISEATTPTTPTLPTTPTIPTTPQTPTTIQDCLQLPPPARLQCIRDLLDNGRW